MARCALPGTANTRRCGGFGFGVAEVALNGTTSKGTPNTFATSSSNFPSSPTW